MNIDLYNKAGENVGTVKVEETVFGAKVNPELMKQLLQYQLVNKREAIANTKIKSEVRGGGRKPFRQKGTGRARQGSTRNPHYIGGGVAFGPKKERNFKISMPKKQRRKGMFSALAARMEENAILALNDFKLESFKTKDVVDFVESMKARSILIITPEKDVLLKRSADNVSNVKVIMVNYLNIFDLLKYEKICFFEKSLPKITEIFKV